MKLPKITDQTQIKINTDREYVAVRNLLEQLGYGIYKFAKQEDYISGGCSLTYCSFDDVWCRTLTKNDAMTLSEFTLKFFGPEDPKEVAKKELQEDIDKQKKILEDMENKLAEM